MEISELSSERQTLCDWNIKLKTCAEINIMITSENCVYSRLIIVVRILILLSIPMLSHTGNTSGNLEPHLEEICIDCIEENVRIDGDRMSEHFMSEIDP